MPPAQPDLPVRVPPLLPAPDRDEADTRKLGDLRHQPRIGERLDIAQRQAFEVRASVKPARRRDSPCCTPVDSAGRSEQRAAGVHRRLDLLLGDVDVEHEVELQRDDRAPNELVDVICLRPGICPNCRSSGAVTAVAITSGLAPG